MFYSSVPSSDVRVHSFASGSSGNAMLVQAANTNLLIDAGLSARTLSSHLAKRGVRMADLDAILLTHEHSDHSSGAGAMSRRAGAPLVANAATLQAYAERDELACLSRELPTGGEMGIGSVGVRSFSICHNAADPVGFILEAGSTRIVYCTDVGCVERPLREALRQANLAIVEANHDLDWLWRGPYTPEMKAQVASRQGHLANLDCAGMLAERLETDGSLTIWLAHLSRVNNSPSLARRSVTETIRKSTRVPFILEVALRDHPSLSWKAGLGSVQLSLL